MPNFGEKVVWLKSFKKFQPIFVLKTFLQIARTDYKKNYLPEIAPFHFLLAQSYAEITT